MRASAWQRALGAWVCGVKWWHERLTIFGEIALVWFTKCDDLCGKAGAGVKSWGLTRRESPCKILYRMSVAVQCLSVVCNLYVLTGWLCMIVNKEDCFAETNGGCVLCSTINDFNGKW